MTKLFCDPCKIINSPFVHVPIVSASKSLVVLILGSPNLYNCEFIILQGSLKSLVMKSAGFFNDSVYQIFIMLFGNSKEIFFNSSTNPLIALSRSVFFKATCGLSMAMLQRESHLK